MYISAINSLSKTSNANYGHVNKTEKTNSNVSFKAYNNAIENAIHYLEPKTKSELVNGVESLIRNVVYERGTAKHYGADILTGGGSLETKLKNIGRKCSFGDTLVSKDGDALITASEEGLEFHGSQKMRVSIDGSKLALEKPHDKFVFGSDGGKHIVYDSDYSGSKTTHYNRFGEERGFRNFIEDVFYI